MEFSHDFEVTEMIFKKAALNEYFSQCLLQLSQMSQNAAGFTLSFNADRMATEFSLCLYWSSSLNRLCVLSSPHAAQNFITGLEVL